MLDVDMLDVSPNASSSVQSLRPVGVAMAMRREKNPPRCRQTTARFARGRSAAGFKPSERGAGEGIESGPQA